MTPPAPAGLTAALCGCMQSFTWSSSWPAFIFALVLPHQLALYTNEGGCDYPKYKKTFMDLYIVRFPRTKKVVMIQ